jgi:hypothetical protein
MIRAGMPTAVQPAGTSHRTTAFAPIFAPSPIVKPPRILAPAPISTPAPITGAPRCHPRRPIVTCWKIKQFGPMTDAG